MEFSSFEPLAAKDVAWVYGVIVMGPGCSSRAVTRQASPDTPPYGTSWSKPTSCHASAPASHTLAVHSGQVDQGGAATFGCPSQLHRPLCPSVRIDEIAEVRECVINHNAMIACCASSVETHRGHRHAAWLFLVPWSCGDCSGVMGMAANRSRLHSDISPGIVDRSDACDGSLRPQGAGVAISATVLARCASC